CSVTVVQTCALPIFDIGSPSERQGPNNLVLGWTPDGKRVLVRSRDLSWEGRGGRRCAGGGEGGLSGARPLRWADRGGRLFRVSVEGGFPEQVGVPEGGFATYSPDGKKLFYNR